MANEVFNQDETPTLAKLLQTAIESRLAELHVSMPGVVEKYNRATQTCDVQPSFKRKYANGNIVNLPVIQNVPVTYFRASGGHVYMDLKKGDGVLLVISERSLDNWIDKGGVVSPEDRRKHSLTDAIAIAGLEARNKPLALKGAPDSLEMVKGSSYIELIPTGKFKIANAQYELFAVLVELLEKLIAAKVLTAIGPQPFWTTTLTDLASIKAKLESLKG